jgi:ribonuclease E
MVKKMLIDATHKEEMRVAIMDGTRLDDFEGETATKKQLKGNIYLAKVIRIEPSLQAAFVEFGNNRHGFLPFAEIHPDYYRIPIGDRSTTEATPQTDTPTPPPESTIEDETAALENVLPEIQEAEPNSELVVDENLDLSDDEDGLILRPKLYKYKIQEVVKRRQIMLVQVVKEERGTKGAALTTYLSLPGRYCVLMPNAGHRSGGISRKISDIKDRQRLRKILNELNIPEGMSLIVRTAGQERNKLEIRRDFEYLLRLWNEIRETTLTSIAPTLIYAEGDLIKRTIRDGYNKDIDQILIDGDEAYKAAKSFMKTLMPSHAKKVQFYRDSSMPLFQRYQVETQIDAIMNPVAPLPSGGSIVINPTEALVAIDVNSGKSTRERHIDETALKTNLEAADEVARQMRLRDLGGLIVIDFIDMNDPKHIQAVEKRLRDAVKRDRARIQIGRISQFGLLELSRQRLRPSILEANMMPCSHCHGTGLVRSLESMALYALRAIESEGISGRSSEIVVTMPPGVDLYILNQKRATLIGLEQRYQMTVLIQRDETLSSNIRLDRLAEKPKIHPTRAKDIKADTPLEEQKSKESPVEKEITPEVTTQPSKTDKRSRHKHFTQRRRSANDRKREAVSIESSEPIDAVDATPHISGEEPKPVDQAVTTTSSPQEEKPSERRRQRHRRQRYRGQQNRRQHRPKETPEGEEEPAPTPKEGSVTPVVSDEAIKKSPSPVSGPQEQDGEKKKNRRGWWKRLLEA